MEFAAINSKFMVRDSNNGTVVVSMEVELPKSHEEMVGMLNKGLDVLIRTIVEACGGKTIERQEFNPGEEFANVTIDQFFQSQKKGMN